MKQEIRIEEPRIERDERERITRVNLVFGPHHFVEVFLEDERVQCSIGYTHHGVRADAGDVPSDFERMINRLQREFPERSF